MSFDVFINFDGNCREALDFYSKAFQSPIVDLMTYGDAPPSPDFEVAESDKNLVMYAAIEVAGGTPMFCDVPSGMPLIKGNTVSPTLGIEDIAEIDRIFAALAEGGTIDAPLAKTFWSAYYGMVTDKHGITWQLTATCEMEP